MVWRVGGAAELMLSGWLAGGRLVFFRWQAGRSSLCLGVKYWRKSSGMDLEGQELLRVHVVERAQVGQLEQQLGEDGRLVGVVLGDEAPQGADQRLLQRLHRVHVLDA